MAAHMAADCGGLRRLFEKPMPENPTLLEALSAWNHHSVVHPSNKPVDPASFTEIFGELHFPEKPPPDHRAVLPPPAWVDEADKSLDDSSLDALLRPKPAASNGVKRTASFCGVKKKSSASSLLMCTEGLGSESTVDADDMLKDGEYAAAAISEETDAERAADVEEEKEELKENRPPASFPPPIRSIGRGGKPCVCFRSFRADGRFALMEVVIPGKELLHAYRDGGRLRLQFFATAAGGVDVDEEVHGHVEGTPRTRSRPRADQMPCPS